MTLTGQRALVSGGGAGIGSGCASELARRGASVIVNDRPGAGLADRTAEAIRAAGGAAEALEADVFTRSGCEALVHGAIERAGRLDILVSCPAFSIRKPMLDYSPDEFQRTMTGTFEHHFHLSQLAARQMVQQGGGGKIVFISSVRSFCPFRLSAPYNAAKGALNQMAFTLANELAQYRINVNVIEPGWTDTPGERLFHTDAEIAAAGPTLPLGRLGTPADIGRAAAFLVSPDADYVTGAVLRVDGGIWMRNLAPR